MFLNHLKGLGEGRKIDVCLFYPIFPQQTSICWVAAVYIFLKQCTYKATINSILVLLWYNQWKLSGNNYHWLFIILLSKFLWRKLAGIRERKFLSDFPKYSDTVYQPNTFTGHACYFIQTHITMSVINPCVSHVFIVNEAEEKSGIYEPSVMANN